MALAFPNRIIEGTAGLAYLEPTKVEPNLFAGHNNPGDPPLRRAVRPPQSPRSGPRCGPRCGTWTGTGTRQRKGRWIHLDRPHSVMRHEPLHSPSAPFRILVGNLHPKKRSGIFWRTMGQTCLKLRCNNKASRLQRVQGRPAATLSSGTSRSGRSSLQRPDVDFIEIDMCAFGLGPPDEPNHFYRHRTGLAFPHHPPLRQALLRPGSVHCTSMFRSRETAQECPCLAAPKPGSTQLVLFAVSSWPWLKLWWWGERASHVSKWHLQFHVLNPSRPEPAARDPMGWDGHQFVYEETEEAEADGHEGATSSSSGRQWVEGRAGRGSTAQSG